MEIKKNLETVILKFLKMSKKNTGPILEIFRKKFSNGEKKKLEKVFSYGKISKIISEKVTKKYGNQEKIWNFSYKCIN